jgi:type IV pilus assembly protein PilO
MAIARKRASIDWQTLQQNLRRQFVGLDPNDPSRWPPLPRTLVLVLAGFLVAGLLWYLVVADRQSALEAAQEREGTLRQEFTRKAGKAAALDTLKSQLEQVRQYVAQLEKQLPNRAEMDALLSDINQAGLGRGLQFELFRPGQEVVKNYYAELPITVRVSGSYHDMGMFAADIASLSRIVTLNNMSIGPIPNRSDALAMEATVKTFRYLDPEEVEAQKGAGKGAQGGKK